MRLGDFIATNVAPILADWETFARSLAPGAKMEVLELRNDAESILLATVRDMRTRQTSEEQASKSKGQGLKAATSDELDAASSMHGVGRVGSGFNVMEVVSEYRALRASVLRLWRHSNPDPDVKISMTSAASTNRSTSRWPRPSAPTASGWTKPAACSWAYSRMTCATR